MTQNLASSQHKQLSSPLDTTPSVAVTGGDPVVLNGGIVGAYDRDTAASELGTVIRHGIRRLKKDGTSGPVFAVGDTVVYDASAGLAVAAGLDADGSADIPYGICCAAAGTNQDHVLVIPFDILNRHAVVSPFVFEFDCDGDNGDTDEHVLIPAWQNRHGLVIESVYALVTEVFAGSSEDQGIVTIEDEDDNVIGTLTASNAGADAVNDVIVGTGGVIGATTGDAAKVVAAGKAVQGFVSQQTSGGTPAGKMKVYIVARPLV